MKAQIHAWQAGDRFCVAMNCDVDTEPLVFELTKRGKARGRGRSGDGWYFRAPALDREGPATRWYALTDFERDLASGRIRRVERERSASR